MQVLPYIKNEGSPIVNTANGMSPVRPIYLQHHCISGWTGSLHHCLCFLTNPMNILNTVWYSFYEDGLIPEPKLILKKKTQYGHCWELNIVIWTDNCTNLKTVPDFAARM